MMKTYPTVQPRLAAPPKNNAALEAKGPDGSAIHWRGRPRRWETTPWRSALLVFCSVVIGMTASAQTIYKSVGPDGQVTYSDRAPSNGRLEKTMKFADLPSSALPASSASFMEEFRRTHAGAAPAAAATQGVTLYSAAWCKYCAQAKAWLAAKSIAYQDVDVDTRSGMAALAQATGGRSAIPVLVVDGQTVNGFSVAAYDAVFSKSR